MRTVTGKDIFRDRRRRLRIERKAVPTTNHAIKQNRHEMLNWNFWGGIFFSVTSLIMNWPDNLDKKVREETH